MITKKSMKIEQLDTYGVGHNCLISAVKIGKTMFIVSSYFENDRTFSDAMGGEAYKGVLKLLFHMA